MSTMFSTLSRFSALPGAEIGQPIAWGYSKPEWTKYVEAHVSTFPFLRGDAGYVNFLEQCGGASIRSGEMEELQYVGAVIFGFKQFEDPNEPAVDENGLYWFCSLQVRYRPRERDSLSDGILDYRFGFATAGNEGGVYRSCGVIGLERSPIQYACVRFETWLDVFVEKRGRFLPQVGDPVN